jgi:hypothetical protein
MAYVIQETRKSDFEPDECFVHATLYHDAEEADRAAKRAVGASVRYQIVNDNVEDPRDLDFDLGVCDPNVFEVEGPSWSCHCEVCEVTERTPFEVIRVDHDYFNDNRTEICTIGHSDTCEGAVNIIEVDAAQEIELIVDRLEDYGARLTFVNNYELIGKELYSEYFIRNNA